jgi:hypothetical protein
MDIGPPPEFGRDGTPPPIASNPVEIARWDLNQTLFTMVENGLAAARLADRIEGGASAGLGRAFLAVPFMVRVHFQEKKAIQSWLQVRGASHLNWEKVGGWKLHAVYTHSWQREDPTTQLPPGGTTEITLSLRVGLSQEHLHEVATSLGVSGQGGNPLGLSSQLSEKSSMKIALSTEKQVTRKVILTNPSNDMYRLFALWHVVHRLLLIATPRSESDPEKELVCQVTEFIPSDVTNVTSVDRARP